MDWKANCPYPTLRNRGSQASRGWQVGDRGDELRESKQMPKLVNLDLETPWRRLGMQEEGSEAGLRAENAWFGGQKRENPRVFACFSLFSIYGVSRFWMAEGL
jgi:hypothetical protein